MKIPSTELTNHGTRKLLAAILLTMALWGILLPAVAKLPYVRQRIEWLEEKQIDPSAMFYTELECTDRLLLP